MDTSRSLPINSAFMLSSRLSQQVGIIVGRSVNGKDFVLHVIKSPDLENGEPACVKVAETASTKLQQSGKKGKTSTALASGSKLAIAADWIAAHAVQVVRTLCGGLDVLGVYALCEESAFQRSATQIVGVLDLLREEGACSSISSPLVLHIDAITAKLSARELGQGGNALKPADVKTGAGLNALVEVRCRYAVNLQLSLLDDKQTLEKAVEEGCRWEMKHRVRPAIAVSHSDGTPFENLSQQLSGVVNIDLAAPFCATIPSIFRHSPHGNANKSKINGEQTYTSCGTLSIMGTLDCRAFVGARESLEAAVDALKLDIERSLQGRLDVLVEAAEDATEAAQEQLKVAQDGQEMPRHPLLTELSNVSSYNFAFPRRTYLKWKNGQGAVCDYIVGGEGVTEVLERLHQILGEDAVDPSTFACEEKLVVKASSRLEPRGKQIGTKKYFLECNAVLVGAALCAAGAVWLAWTLSG